LQAWPALALYGALVALAPYGVAAQHEDLLDEDLQGDDLEGDVAEHDAEGDDLAEETAEETAEPDEVTTRAVSLYAGAGFGFGTVSFERPTAAGAQALERTPFAATDVVVRVRAWPDESFMLETLLAYQSSLGLRLQSEPLFGLPQTVSARVQRGELSVAPALRLGAADAPLALAFPVGFGFQSLVSEAHQYGMPQYVVGGPHLRVELHAELGEIFHLRIGPEAQWILVIASSLREEDACCQGVGFGAQCSVEAEIGSHLRLALAYRQLTSTLPARGASFEDVERFFTARIAGGF
jgi:hypothetical protein